MTTRVRLLSFVAVVLFTPSVGSASATQRGGAGGAQQPLSAREVAPMDLTGYWVSYVSKEWRFRMVTPERGDLTGEFGGIPLTREARLAANDWDPESDEATGEACRAYGAAGLMRIPTRLHITWEDDNTLRVDTDAGMQTRLFRFGAGTGTAEGAEATWQGESGARWVFPTVIRGRVAQAPSGTAGQVGAQPGSLEVVTTNLRPGYLRRNGVPYSEETVMTEYWDVFKEPDGTDWLVLTSTIEDPRNLQMPYQTTPAFKREPDGSLWDPAPCSAR